MRMVQERAALEGSSSSTCSRGFGRDASVVRFLQGSDSRQPGAERHCDCSSANHRRKVEAGFRVLSMLPMASTQTPLSAEALKYGGCHTQYNRTLSTFFRGVSRHCHHVPPRRKGSWFFALQCSLFAVTTLRGCAVRVKGFSTYCSIWCPLHSLDTHFFSKDLPRRG